VANDPRMTHAAFQYCELFECVEVIHHEGPVAKVKEVKFKYERRDLLDVWLKQVL
jgi:hypothetical protein